MENLAESSQIFEASSRLASAATAVKRLVDSGTLSESDKKALEWAYDFLAQVDWSSTAPSRSAPTMGLSVQATVVRPAFYAALRSIARKLDRAGVSDNGELDQFLGQVFDLLGKNCETIVKSLPGERARLAVTFIYDLSSSLLTQLTHNGLPIHKDK